GRITVGERGISSGYLKAVGAPLLAGQDCPSLRALTRNAPKALVSRRFAEMYGKGQNLVGRHFQWFQSRLDGPAYEIVGVVGAMKEDELNVTPAPYAYVCLNPGDWPDPEYVVRTRGDTRVLAAALPSI